MAATNGPGSEKIGRFLYRLDYHAQRDFLVDLAVEYSRAGVEKPRISVDPLPFSPERREVEPVNLLEVFRRLQHIGGGLLDQAPHDLGIACVNLPIVIQINPRKHQNGV